MKNLILLCPVLLATAACTACLATEEPMSATRILPTVTVELPTGSLSASDYQAFCDGIIETEGPCLLACDYDAFSEEYGIPGQCVEYICHSTEYPEFVLGICMPPVADAELEIEWDRHEVLEKKVF